MNQIVKNSLDNGLTYSAYLDLVQRLIAEGKSTGNERSENRIKFTKINASRLKRLNKTLVLSDEGLSHFGQCDLKQTWLVLAESWCADGAQVLPVLNKIAEAIDGIELKVLLRDQNPQLMNEYQTNGNCP